MEDDEFFDMMGNEVRRKIINFLARGPKSINELNQFIDVSRQAILKQLNELEKLGIIQAREANERPKKTGPAPYEYSLKKVFTVHYDIGSVGGNPYIVRMEIAPTADIPQEHPDLSTVISLKEEFEKINQVNDDLENLSTEYQEKYSQKIQSQRHIQEFIRDRIDAVEEQNVLQLLLVNPKKAVQGFSGEEISDALNMRKEFVDLVLENLVRMGLLKKNDDEKYIVT
jgi:predicted transcriptional regulator